MRPTIAVGLFVLSELLPSAMGTCFTICDCCYNTTPERDRIYSYHHNKQGKGIYQPYDGTQHDKLDVWTCLRVSVLAVAVRGDGGIGMLNAVEGVGGVLESVLGGGKYALWARRCGRTNRLVQRDYGQNWAIQRRWWEWPFAPSNESRT
ncbi:unnamed protein product [Zymoseptoria tritici ST99CH_1A5]|uniref:Secreted protein n=1 Tax=Zymoseptoria tritici ST99CH_1A5 TaxID=1276529 RepID=A0A1Y6LII1_ZYMTR|nr:unnamed protein product [Zymoseptoria tritici ST99CH_3D1]SMY24262.1 unnamed protein product [Zymoseptoria tritici ST99CH_1A5]